jgi:hypothetical protein
MESCLVFVFGKVPVNAVVADIELAADKPFPEGGITGIKGGMPGLVPIQKISILPETVREIIQAEPVINRPIVYICLGNELF